MSCPTARPARGPRPTGPTRSDTRLVLTTLAAFAALFLVVFAAMSARRPASREHAEASASAVAFGGGRAGRRRIVVSGMVSLAAARAGGEGDAEAVVPLDHLAQSTWVPVTAGLAVMMLAAGVGGLLSPARCRGRLRGRPCVLGLMLLTPAGLVGFMLSPLWIIAVSVILFRRAQSYAYDPVRST